MGGKTPRCRPLYKALDKGIVQGLVCPLDGSLDGSLVCPSHTFRLSGFQAFKLFCRAASLLGYRFASRCKARSSLSFTKHEYARARREEETRKTTRNVRENRGGK